MSTLCFRRWLTAALNASSSWVTFSISLPFAAQRWRQRLAKQHLLSGICCNVTLRESGITKHVFLSYQFSCRLWWCSLHHHICSVFLCYTDVFPSSRIVIQLSLTFLVGNLPRVSSPWNTAPSWPDTCFHDVDVINVLIQLWGNKIHLRNMVGGSCVSASCSSISPSFCIVTHFCSFTDGHLCQSHFSSSHVSYPLEYLQSFLSISGDMFAGANCHSLPIHSTDCVLSPKGHSNCKQTDTFNLVITEFPQVQFVRTERWDTYHLKVKETNSFTKLSRITTRRTNNAPTIPRSKRNRRKQQKHIHSMQTRWIAVHGKHHRGAPTAVCERDKFRITARSWLICVYVWNSRSRNSFNRKKNNNLTPTPRRWPTVSLTPYSSDHHYKFEYRGHVETNDDDAWRSILMRRSLDRGKEQCRLSFFVVESLLRSYDDTCLSWKPRRS